MGSMHLKPRDSDTRITLERIDELLAWLPRLAELTQAPIREWELKRSPEGHLLVTPPLYTGEVYSFFHAAGQPWWCDYGYVPENAGRWVQDDAFIARASLDQVKTMLTFCVRGERFCDGLWAGVLGNGRIAAILNRLKILRDEMAKKD